MWRNYAKNRISIVPVILGERIGSNPKYNSEYLEKIVKTKWLKKLEKLEKGENKKWQL